MSEVVDNTKEVWKTIEEFPAYSVSNLGRVKSHHTRKSGLKAVDGILKPSSNRDGYTHVVLFQNGVRKILRIHRLVAVAFVEKPDGKDEVNHKNGIRSDNVYSNLEWMTTGENVQHSYSELGNKGMVGELNGRTSLTDKKVFEIKKTMKYNWSDSEIANQFGISRAAAWRIRNNKSWTHIPGP